MSNESVGIEIENAGISFDAAFNEARSENHLSKPGDFNGTVAVLSIDDQTKAKLRTMGGRTRVGYHLLRLLSEGRSDVERNFGLAYLNYASNAINELKSEDMEKAWKAQDVIGLEGENTCMWWTYAPYIYQTLTKENGINEQDSFGRVIRWAESGFSEDEKAYIASGLHLRGLEGFNKYRSGGLSSSSYVLSRNSQGPSHQLTRHVAKQIVDTGLV